MNNAAESIPSPSAARVLEETNFLISLPGVCLRLREIMADSSHSRREVVEAISHDSALTARLLRIVNSAYFSLSQPVSNISHALTILGEQELKNLVVVTSIVNSMSASISHMDMNRYWRASLYNAVVARNMARCCEIDELEIEELFISGLLLNVGKLPLYYSEPDLLLLVEERASVSGLPDYQIERELLGFDHAEVGALLAKSWNFSAQLNRLISGHHAVFSSDISKQEAIISLSAQLADSLNYDNNGSVCHEQPAENEAELLEKLKLSVDEYELIVTNSFEDYLLAYEAFCGSNI